MFYDCNCNDILLHRDSVLHVSFSDLCQLDPHPLPPSSMVWCSPPCRLDAMNAQLLSQLVSTAYLNHFKSISFSFSFSFNYQLWCHFMLINFSFDLFCVKLFSLETTKYFVTYFTISSSCSTLYSIAIVIFIAWLTLWYDLRPELLLIHCPLSTRET